MEKIRSLDNRKTVIKIQMTVLQTALKNYKLLTNIWLLTVKYMLTDT